MVKKVTYTLLKCHLSLEQGESGNIIRTADCNSLFNNHLIRQLCLDIGTVDVKNTLTLSLVHKTVLVVAR